jgi:FtsP/CotA-like multicopper oxidase with cupredoxin domain
LAAAAVLALQPAALRAQHAAPKAHDVAGDTAEVMGRMPPMQAGMNMRLGLANERPSVQPWLPGEGVDPSTLPEAEPNHTIRMSDGDTLDLTAGLVRRTLRGKTVIMYAFNNQYPGPLIRVKRGTTIVVRFHNHLDLPSTVHWHGLRIENRYDGVPGVTQKPVPPGGDFVYHVHFQDAGVYWYHPHVRGDIEISAGLYGNEIVDSPIYGFDNPVNREQQLMLSDLLFDKHGLFPYGKTIADFAIMGRFGNLFLVNGEPDFHMKIHAGDVVRYYITDVSSSRSYNVVFAGGKTKLVGADMGAFEHEAWVPSIPIAVAQRYVAEVRYDSAGRFPILNRVQAINHVKGTFFPEVDTLGMVEVSPQPSDSDFSKSFGTLHDRDSVQADIERYRKYFDKPVDKRLELTVNIQGLPGRVQTLMASDTMYYPPVEWNDGMPKMNWISTGHEVRWILRDPDTGKENMDIGWHFKTGSVVKIRIHNDPLSMHPMNHPIHFHGQRFLVLSRDGVPTENLVWKDTVLVPVGSTVVILMDASNPGTWFAHCHIAEHLDTGMKMTFTVGPSP